MTHQRVGADAALAAFRAGDPVLIHDFADREGETDLVYPAGAVTATDVARLRNDAGGLVCVAVPDDAARAFGLSFLADELDHPAADGGDLSYDDRSSFSLPVNHRETFTGITDEDRALTISELAAAAETARSDHAYDQTTFAESFRAPGHVHVLRGAPDGLADRAGHTELGLALAEAAGVQPAVVVCEMLDDDTGRALTPEAGRAYADHNGFPYVDGEELIERLS
ncbi:MAG: 3,4-dihydroxy-2-butanone 4-phosphate synthase [halophilic archaeon J07HB67]|nr:MAG: 3,4-dihydroxy-2-butanone 4-phosphate synthase [halophilic archaeon J07HB67]